jgi:glycosyltransferase involved in cell wall biosynthesis
MPRTITHVIPYMHPNAGGPPVVVDRLCRLLAIRDWKLHVITTDCMGDPREGRSGDFGNEPYSLEVHKTSRLRGYAYSSTLSAALSAAAKKSELMHLHTLWTYSTCVAARVCRKIGTPYVVMPHGMLDPNSLSRKGLKKRIYGQLIEWPYLRRAAGMIYTHSEERRLAAESVAQLPEGHVVPLGADDPPSVSRHELAERFFVKHPGARGRDLILFFGRLHPKKGVDLLISAFAELRPKYPNVRLLLVGPGDEAYVRALNQQVVQLGLDGDVTFTGPLTGIDKWQAIAASKVFVLPSHQENFAITVVEALRMGLPVVLSRRVNLWQDVVEAGAGLACDMSPLGVAREIGRYLDDPVLRSASGAAGQVLVEANFTWDRCADSTDAIYRNLLRIDSKPVRTVHGDATATA